MAIDEKHHRKVIYLWQVAALCAAIVFVVLLVAWLARRGAAAQNDTLMKFHQETRDVLIDEIRLNRLEIQRFVKASTQPIVEEIRATTEPTNRTK